MKLKWLKNIKKYASWLAMLAQLLQPVSAAASAVVDKSAPGDNKPYVEMMAGGLPVVQITTPSAAGVSRNVFSQFDVYSQGLILNNSRDMVHTQLAGYIAGNPYMFKGMARIILNEVTGPKASFLNGYTEVAGQKAEVIIANPSGIVVNGAGFINTDRAVLTTGTSIWNANGGLAGFRVAGGQIAVEGAGLNASNLVQVDLISRAAAINAEIWANRLNVVTGANQVSYETVTPVAIQGDSHKPDVALDVGALGGMYANKIFLVGTENGVGVNNKGVIAATVNDVTVTNEGKVILGGKVSAKENITIHTEDDVDNQGATYAEHNTGITAKGAVINSGVLSTGQALTINAGRVDSTGVMGAGTASDGTVGEHGDITVTASGTLRAAGQTTAAGNLTLAANDIDLSGGNTYAGGDTRLTAAGNISNNGGWLRSAGSLDAAARGAILNNKDAQGKAAVMQANAVTLSADSLSNRGGTIVQIGTDTTRITATHTIDNTQGGIVTNGEDLVIKANTLTGPQEWLEHTGGGVLSVEAANVVNDSGTITTKGHIDIRSDLTSNRSGTITQLGAAATHLTATKNLDNTSGTIVTNGENLMIDAGFLGNSGGLLEHAGTGVLTVQTNNLTNNSGSITTNGAIDIAAGFISNRGGSIAQKGTGSTFITATRGIDNTLGSIATNGRDLFIQADSLTNSDGRIQHAGSGDVSVHVAQDIVNSFGVLTSNGSINLSAASISNIHGAVSANHSVAITAQADLNNVGGTIAGDVLQIAARGEVDNYAGLMAANGSASIYAGSLSNQGGTVLAGNNIAITVADNLDSNAASRIASGSNLTITSDGSATLAGVTSAVGNIHTQAANSVANHGILYAGQNADMVSAGTITNTGTLFAGNNTTLSARVIQSSGALGAGVANSGALQTAGNLTITAADTIIASGQNIAAQQLTATASGLDFSGSQTYAGGDAFLAAQTDDIEHSGAVMQVGGMLAVSAAGAIHNGKTSANSGGIIQAGQVSLTAAAIDNSGGSIVQTASNGTAKLVAAGNIDNTGGRIAANSDTLTLGAQTLDNSSGRVEHAGSGQMSVTVDQKITNLGGRLVSNGKADVRTDTLLNRQGTVSATGPVGITAGELNNQSGTIVSGGDIQIAADRSTINQGGTIAAGGQVGLNTASLTNNGGNISSLGQGSMAITIGQALGNADGFIGGNGDVNIVSGTLDNTNGKIQAMGNLTITAQQEVDDTKGYLAAGQDVTIIKDSPSLNNTQGKMAAGKSLSLKAAVIQNDQGSVSAKQNVNVAFAQLAGAGSVTSDEDILLNVDGTYAYENGNVLKTGGNIILNATGAVINRGDVEAGGEFQISGNSFLNETGAILVSQKTLSVNSATDIVNHGILAGNYLTLKAQNIENSGEGAAISATNTINITADKTLLNQGKATIYSVGDINITIPGSADPADPAVAQQTGILYNRSGTIEAGNDITISAKKVVNEKQEFVTEQQVVSSAYHLDEYNFQTVGTGQPADFLNFVPWNGSGTTVEGNIISQETDHLNIFQVGNGTNNYYNSIVEDQEQSKIYYLGEDVRRMTIVKDSPQGKITANNNLNLYAPETVNNMSWILARNTLTAAGNVQNISTHNTQTYTQYYAEMIPTIDYSSGWNSTLIGISTKSTTENIDGGVFAVFGGGRQVTIQGSNVSNGDAPATAPEPKPSPISASGVPAAVTVAVTAPGSGVTPQIGNVLQAAASVPSAAVPDFFIPANTVSLFPTAVAGTTSPYAGVYDPSKPTLSYTPPAFDNVPAITNLLIDKVGLDPKAALNRKPDDAYAQRQVSDQITAMTGRMALGGYVSAQQQYQSLLANGQAQADALAITPGIALSPQQAAALKQDMVWMVDKEVNGQIVREPVVYLAQLSAGNLRPNGSIIAADKIDITADHVDNSGTIKAGKSLDITAGDITNTNGGRIDGGATTKLTARQDITNSNASISGDNVQIVAGHDALFSAATIAAGENLAIGAGNNIIMTAEQTHTATRQGTDKNYSILDTTTNRTTQFSAGGDATLIAGGDIALSGVQGEVGGSLEVWAGGNVGMTAVKDSVQEQTAITKKGKNIWSEVEVDEFFDSKDVVTGTNLKAGGDAVINAGQSATLLGSSLTSENGMAAIVAGGPISLQAETATQESSSKAGKNQNHNITNQAAGSAISGQDVYLRSSDAMNIQGSQVNGKDDVTLLAQTGLTMSSSAQLSTSESSGKDWYNNQNQTTQQTSAITSGGDLTIMTGGNLDVSGASLSADKTIQALVQGDIHLADIKNSQTSENKQGKKLNSSHDETSIGTTLAADSDIQLKTVQSLNLEGSSIISQQGKVDLTAGKEVNIQATMEEHETYSESKKTSHGILSKKTTVKKEYTLVDQVAGSEVSGDQVHVTAGTDLTVAGSDLVGTSGLSLTAGNNLNILSADEFGGTDYYKKTTKSGLFGGGLFGITIGSQSQKTTVKEQVLNEIASTLGSLDGDVSLTAGNQVVSQGTSIIAGGDIDISGKGVTLDNTLNIYDRYTQYQFKQSGLSISVGGGVVDAIQSAGQNLQNAQQAADDRLKGLYAVKAAQDAETIHKADKSGDIGKDVTVNISLGSSKTSYEQTIHKETVNSSNLSGKDINITATDDIKLRAVNLSGQDITLKAGGDIGIREADNLYSEQTSSKSSSWSAGVALNQGVFGSISQSKGNSNEQDIQKQGSHITARGEATLEAGHDIDISGSQVGGDSVRVDAGNNLNIASQQDSSTYKETNKQSGISAGVGKGTSASVSNGKTNSNYQSVTEPGGIFAGQGGFDIYVGGNTDLKGAVIASDATPDKNKLSTGTLTFSDIQNNAEYSASSSGVNYNSKLEPGMTLGDLGLTPNIGVKVSGDADSTTKSAIAPGTIEIRDNPGQDLSNLSRDTNNSLNSLGKIFDKQTVKEKQELSALFGEVAFEELHKISDKNGWNDGDPQKVALHAAVGAIMAKIGGGNALSGGFSAGVNEALQKELSNIQDPALRQWVSYAIGSAASAVAGGTPQTGGSIAASGTKNNNLGYVIAAIHMIPGVGEIAITVDGAIIVAGVAYLAGSAVYEWAYDKYMSSSISDAVEKGEPTDNHSTSSASSLSKYGEPNSSVDLLNPDGSVKQRRYYGEDGVAYEDIDYNHSNGDESHTFPHRHKWPEGKRGKEVSY